MFFRLLLLFTAVPLIELALLVEIGRVVGLPATLALVLFTGALGAFLARGQGLATLARVQQDMAEGRMPTDALLDGLMILIAGAVLLTPGVLTDLFGFAMLTPAFRRRVKRSVAASFRKRFAGSSPRVIVVEPEDR